MKVRQCHWPREGPLVTSYATGASAVGAHTLGLRDLRLYGSAPRESILSLEGAAIQPQSPGRKHVPASRQPSPRRTQVKRLIFGWWAVGSALVFYLFLQIGVEDRAALPLVAILCPRRSLPGRSACSRDITPSAGWP